MSADPAEQLRTDRSTVADSALVADESHALSCSVDCAPVGVALRRERPEHIVVSVDFDRATVVSVAQQALAGWTVTIDGAEVDVVEVDGMFLGVAVPPGEHELEFTYRSPWLAATLVVALLSIAATIALVITETLIVRRRTQAASDHNR